ncbi:hypothetical protein HPB52_008047 [Rhipicephalus sanguineus]|uniref:AMP-dependent synthetase/ligase domain-containing protein n=1 Tax=Rhipicephalus sanguineus TaxID=34632 RepID=A0A9D4PFD8_RHISA|nr:hypothetical protein HPB52_008047 [Rhipicephalus sanguineus]
MIEAPIKDGVVSSPYPPVELIQDQALYQHIKKRFLEHCDKPALERNGEFLTFAELLSVIERYAVGFQRYGVSSGRRVCVSVTNSAESIIAAYSLCVLGATVVLVKTTLPELTGSALMLGPLPCLTTVLVASCVVVSVAVDLPPVFIVALVALLLAGSHCTYAVYRFENDATFLLLCSFIAYGA